MGFLDELKKLTKPYSDDEEYEDDFEEEEAEEEPQPQPQPRAARRSAPAAEPAYSAPSPVSERRATSGRVVNINASTQLQVVLVKPERFDNVREVADHLRDKHAVMLNLESTERNTARRIVDFLSGCIYALDGKIKKVANSAYLITPFNVDIVGDLMEELENNGVYI